MSTQKDIAFILAGGLGKRLGSLTHYYSKPVIHFGGVNRIIDFTINNCLQSQIKTIGILGNSVFYDIFFYIKNKYYYNTNKNQICYLAPSTTEKTYLGTANALYKNIDFIDSFNPDNILITAGDHIYEMDYNKLLDFHKNSKADATIASTEVSLSEAPKFGVLKIDKKGRLTSFKEKPQVPDSNLVSMGIYVFNWKALKDRLIADNENFFSCHDFGKNIIPSMLTSGYRIFGYHFNGYWKDVGTIESLWHANMDLIDNKFNPNFDLNMWNGVYNHNSNFISDNANIKDSILSKSCNIFGNIKHSVIADSVTIEKDAEIIDSVIMPNSYIGQNCKIVKTIIGPDVKITENVEIGLFNGINNFVDEELCSRGVSLVGPWTFIQENLKIGKNSHINNSKLLQLYNYATDNKFNHKDNRLKFGINL